MAGRLEGRRPDPVETARTRARYDRIAALYDRMEALAERRRFGPWREALWAGVPAGEVLEVGVGTGKNFPYHPPGARVTGIDLSPRMLERARRRARELGREMELRLGDVQDLPFPDDAFDAAVATFVFCSVPDPVLGLEELRRVVRPGGTLHLLEHVRIDRPLLGALMDLLDPIVVRMVGAHINRQTLENVRRAGWQVEEVTPLAPFNLVLRIRARRGDRPVAP